jgi:NADPH2 dehydrogenase
LTSFPIRHGIHKSSVCEYAAGGQALAIGVKRKTGGHMPDLFSPFTIRHLQFKNRLVMPPMVRFVGEMSTEVAVTGGRVTPAVVEHYLSRVRAGAGTIIVEATAVDPGGRVWENGLNLYANDHIENLAQIADGVREAGGVSCIQLVHGGPQGSADLSGGEIVGPSAIRSADNAALPRELTLPEIKAIESRFVDAAQRAVSAGFDVVEIHGAHGYLLDSFQMTRRNQRKDAYGGSLENRLRMLGETCSAIHERIGKKAIVACRISPFTKRDE